LRYQKRLDLMAQLFVEEIKTMNDIEHVSMDFFHFHNDVCPGCNKSLPNNDGMITDYGVLGMIVLGENEESKTAYLYALCDDGTNICVAEVHHENKSAKMKIFENNLELNVSRKLKI